MWKSVHKWLKSKSSKIFSICLQLKIMQSELNVEEVVNDRSLKVRFLSVFYWFYWTWAVFIQKHVPDGISLLGFQRKVPNSLHPSQDQVNDSSVVNMNHTVFWGPHLELSRDIDPKHLTNPPPPVCCLWLCVSTVKEHYRCPSPVNLFV